MRHLFVLSLLLVGCDDPKNTPDAGMDGDIIFDAPIDMAIDAGPCGAGRFLTGELVDLDSSNASFKGVYNTRLTVQGSAVATETDTTAPNGRFELCVPGGSGAVTLDLVANATATPRYYDGFVYLDGDTVVTPQLISLRAFEQVRGPAFYVERGLTYDPTKAHVLVWTNGDRDIVELDRAHGEPQSGNDDDADGALTWTDDNVGRYVLFPNVDVTNPTGTLSGNALPIDHTIPLAADKLTLVGVAATLLP